MVSLLKGSFQDFPLLVQIVRQNLQNPEGSETMEMVLAKGFASFFEIVLDDLLPAMLNPLDLFNAETVLSIFESFSLNKGQNLDIIFPKIKFFQNKKNRVLVLDAMLSMALVKKDLIRDIFLGNNQEKLEFHLLKKLVIWQVFSEDLRERHLLDQIVLSLLFDSLPEMILTNKTLPFGGSNRRLSLLVNF